MVLVESLFRGSFITDGTAMDIKNGILIGMSVLTTTIDRTHNLGLRSVIAMTCSTNRHIGCVDPRQPVWTFAGHIHFTT